MENLTVLSLLAHSHSVQTCYRFCLIKMVNPLITAWMVLQEIAGASTSISGRTWHSVGVDEAHEMLIKKQCKHQVLCRVADQAIFDNNVQSNEHSSQTISIVLLSTFPTGRNFWKTLQMHPAETLQVNM